MDLLIVVDIILTSAKSIMVKITVQLFHILKTHEDVVYSLLNYCKSKYYIEVYVFLDKKCQAG